MNSTPVPIFKQSVDENVAESPWKSLKVHDGEETMHGISQSELISAWMQQDCSSSTLIDWLISPKLASMVKNKTEQLGGNIEDQ